MRRFYWLGHDDDRSFVNSLATSVSTGGNPFGSSRLRGTKNMSILYRLQWISVGMSLVIGFISWLSLQFGGLGHIPPFIELPGMMVTSLLDRVSPEIVHSGLWPGSYFERLEQLLDKYQCPVGHEYRVEIVHHAPLILRLRGFLPYGEASHLLKLAYLANLSELTFRNERTIDFSSYVTQWTKDDPTRIYLEPDEDLVVACLESRIASMSGYPIQQQEAIQVQLLQINVNIDCEE